MTFPVDIVFRDMPVSEPLTDILKRRAEALGRYHPRIVSCRVLVETQARRHQKGKLFNVKIELGVPGHEIVVERTPTDRLTHTDFRMAEKDAFAAARRQLCALAGKRKHKGSPGIREALVETG